MKSYVSNKISRAKFNVYNYTTFGVLQFEIFTLQCEINVRNIVYFVPGKKLSLFT